jgi:YidC/Oxa1 family membrane protein insertase
MTDIRRTVLWVVFSASLFLIWNAWSVHNGQPSFFGPRPVPAAPAAVSANGATAGSAVLASAATAGTAIPSGTPAAAGEKVTVTTDLVNATFDSKGGDLIRLELLHQHEHPASHWYTPFVELFGGEKPAPDTNVVLFDQSAERYYEAQTGLWPSSAGPGAFPDHHTVMNLVPGDRTLKDGAATLQIQFESPVLSDVKLVKTYTFHRGSYVVDVAHEVLNTGVAAVRPFLYFQLVRDGNPAPGPTGPYSTFTGPAIYTSTSHFDKIEFKAIEKRDSAGKSSHQYAPDGWVAMVQHYFATAWIVDKSTTALAQWDFFTGKLDANLYSVGVIVPVGEVAPGKTKTVDAKLFAGPQEENKLSALAPGLELVKDYGVFKTLAEPLFWVLTQLHKVLANWGWSIVGLVVLLKIAFFWLNATAYKSMAKMKAINPRIMEMRARLKDKPQQMQQEMMRIYREEKVNPLGGCLPIVAQMPFFLSLYWVLLSSVEMRNVPWVGWITDLSSPDPYFILPLMMTATSLLQTWLNPTPPDPVQAKMMWIMPLVFSVMFFFFPAGLVLYWLTNNILSIAQQYLINKKLGVLNK